jgi:hypothetical protein
MVVTEGTYPPDSCFASVEVMDNFLGNTTVAVPGSVAWPPVPVFGMLDVTWFQTVRLNVVAFPPGPCIGQLSFADKNGNPVGTMPVYLNPGQAAFLDLPGAPMYPPTPIHPIVSLAVGDPTACIASVEVYYDLTKQTSAYWPPAPLVPAVAGVGSLIPSPHRVAAPKPRPFKTESEDNCSYRSAEALRHPKSSARRTPRGTILWNPTLAQRTRKDGAPALKPPLILRHLRRG